ncbi:MAG TPA: hypothetical protein PK095_05000 [Myxococcota bacterium]|nr:hypothetical protein [Myxococcota bacterium]
MEGLVWGGPGGNVELVLASHLSQLVGGPPSALRGHGFGAQWPLEAAHEIRRQRTDSEGLVDPAIKRLPELLERLRYVIVVFDDHYLDPFHLGLVPEPAPGMMMIFEGRAAVYALDGARLLAARNLEVAVAPQPSGSGPFASPYFSTKNRLEDEIRGHVAAMVGVSGTPTFGQLMELAPLPESVLQRHGALIVIALVGSGGLVALIVFGRRRHRERYVFDGVQVRFMRRANDALVLIEFTTELAVDISWREKARGGDVPGGDDASEEGPDVRVRGEPLPALYAALAGTPVWRAVLDLGGKVEGDKERLVLTLAHHLGLEARVRRVAAYVRDLRALGDGVQQLSAMLADKENSFATRARIAIALIRWAPDSKAREARERLGWTDPLEPHLVACLTSESDALVIDACGALASVGTAASLTALDQVHRLKGPAMTAANDAILAIRSRRDPRQGGLALPAGEDGALSVQPDD